MNNRYQKGTALILVLLVVAFVSALGVTSVDRLHYEIKKSLDNSLKQQAFWYALGLESKAIDFLKDRHQTITFSSDLLIDQTLPSIIVKLEEGEVEGTLFDLRTCFNLNGIVKYEGDNKLVSNQVGVQQYHNLLSALNIDALDQEQLIYSLIDWIDSNDFAEDTSGAEDDFYTRLDSPYRTPNQVIFNIQELINIKHYGHQKVDLLSPFICALPIAGNTEININAIPKNKPQILVMLFGDQLNLNSASNVLADRPMDGFKDKEEFLSHPDLSNLRLANSTIESISFKSEFYKLRTKVKNKNYPFILESTLHIMESGEVKVISRSEGVF